uniref:Bug family tripartite tricarboxylate transporter substrate binding protein n=1 Tax=Pararhizobium sp. IMCC3301 TaxID=3067904 RepID=UPI0027416511|nr:tripartite tricarboxylate transporter substrate-binding protein [Pararhizobium sp. IMCC3301]
MLNNIRKLALLGLAATFAIQAIPERAVAQDFPNGPIEVINNSRPGGGSDIFLRFATEKAGEILGTDFIHMSKTGGVATNTLKYVSGKPADGQTLFIVNAGTLLTIMRGTVDLSFDDIVPLARGTIDPNYIVVKAGKYADAAAFIDAAKSGPVKQGGTNVGGNPHVEALLMSKEIGMNKQVYVPFEKSGEIVINLVNGNLDVALLNLDEFESQWKAGEVVPLAVLTEERVDSSPDVPTGHEVGLDLDLATVRGIGVLKGTPQPVVDQLEAALIESMNSEGYLKYLEGAGQTSASIAGSEVFAKQLVRLNAGYQAVAEELRLISK